MLHLSANLKYFRFHLPAQSSYRLRNQPNTYVYMRDLICQNNPARTEIQLMAWHERHTPALSIHTNGRATNSQVCFHRHHFFDPVNSWQSTMECVVPLGCTNKAPLGIKLPSATVLAWQVNCGYLCTSMNAQWLLFCSNIWKNLPMAPHPPPPPIYWIHDIAWWGLKKCLKFQQVAIIVIKY